MQAKSIISEISNMFIIEINKYKIVLLKHRSISEYRQDTKPKRGSEVHISEIRNMVKVLVPKTWVLREQCVRLLGNQEIIVH